jgi:hypothetical protein
MKSLADLNDFPIGGSEEARALAVGRFQLPALIFPRDRFLEKQLSIRPRAESRARSDKEPEPRQIK